MSDEDVILHLQEILGVGKVYKRKQKSGRKDTYQYVIYRQQDVYNVLLKILPYLFSRRKEKATELLTHLQSKGIKHALAVNAG